LHSIIGASVFARSSATMLAVIAAIIRSLSLSVTRRPHSMPAAEFRFRAAHFYFRRCRVRVAARSLQIVAT
jgi:hypothetical protein